MSEFKNKEEYEKWKAEKVKAGKENQNNPPQEIPVRTTNVKQSSEIKKAIVWTLAAIVLLAVGYLGYQYYPQKVVQQNILTPQLAMHDIEQKEIATLPKIDSYKEYHSETQDLLIEFDRINKALEIGMNYTDFSRKIADINYPLSKFTDKYSNRPESNYISFMALIRAGNCYKIAAEHWKEKVETPGSVLENYYRIMIQANFNLANRYIPLAEKILADRKKEAEFATEYKTTFLNIDNAENNFKSDIKREQEKLTRNLLDITKGRQP